MPWKKNVKVWENIQTEQGGGKNRWIKKLGGASKKRKVIQGMTIIKGKDIIGKAGGRE